MKKMSSTYDVLINAMKENEYSFDIYYRMAVIDEYLKGNEKIWDLYNKLQQTRCSKIKEVPLEMIDHKKDFINLINAIKLYGYDFNYPILINKDGLIIDGAHRMACSLYFDVPMISIYTSEKYFDFIPADYSKKWFEENELDECIILAETQRKKLKEKMKCINQRKF